MAIIDLFSKRQKRERGEMPDTWRHDVLPPPLRVQVVHIWNEAFGLPRNDVWHLKKAIYSLLAQALRKELGYSDFPIGRASAGQ